MKPLKSLHAITVSYLAPSNARQSRVKMVSNRSKSTKIIPFDHSFKNISEIAQNWLNLNNFGPLYHGDNGDTDIIMCETFKPLK